MPAFLLPPTKGYRVRMSTYWWLDKWPYLKFILRELSSIFVAWFVVELLLQIRAINHGPEAYERFMRFWKNPFVFLFNVLGFFFLLFHAITWFNLAPKAMAVRMGGKRVPAILIAGPNYAAWAVVSAVVVWLLMRG